MLPGAAHSGQCAAGRKFVGDVVGGRKATMPGKVRRNLDNLVCLVCWSLCKNRNPWVFGNTDKQYTAVRLAARVLDEINLWMMARRGTRLGGTRLGVGEGPREE